MSWNAIQTDSDEITHGEWNAMVSGIQHSGFDYIIYKEGGLTHSKQTATGDIKYSNINSSKTINETLSDMTNSGGVCYIEPGIYKISSSIVISGSYTKLLGAGNKTKLTLGNGANCDLIKTKGVGTSNLMQIEIGNMWLSGNKSGQTTSNVVHVTLWNSYIHDLYIKDAKDHGIYHEGGGSSNDDCHFYRNMIYGCNGDGMRLFGASAVPLQNVVGNTIGVCGLCGVRLYGNQTYLACNQIYTFGQSGSSSPGILLDRASRCTIVGNRVYTHHIDGRGIMLTSKGGLSCFENTICNNQIYGTNAANVINIWASGTGTYCGYNVIANNTIRHRNVTHCGINLSGSAGSTINNVVEGNVFSGSLFTKHIYDNGTGNYIRNNIGTGENKYDYISSQVISGGTITCNTLTINTVNTISGLADPTYNSGAASKHYSDNPDYVSSQAISGGSLNPFIMTPTSSEPSKDIGRIWMSGGTTYCRLYMISGNGANVQWKQISFT